MQQIMLLSQNETTSGYKQENNMQIHNLIKNALRRGSVTSSFLNHSVQQQVKDPQQIQRSIRTLSLPNIYAPKGMAQAAQDAQNKSIIQNNSN